KKKRKPDHGKTSNDYRATAYIYPTNESPFDSLIGCIRSSDEQVNTIRILEKSWVVGARRARLVIQDLMPVPQEGQYNLIDQLDKTPARISILDLLKTSTACYPKFAP
ncbi:hypothetical protein KI387_016312, partial [Taxus chinensis]